MAMERVVDRRRGWIQLSILGACILAVVGLTLSVFQAAQERQLAEATRRQLADLIDRSVWDADQRLSRRASTLTVRRRLLAELDEGIVRLSAQDRQKPEVLLLTVQTWQRRGELALQIERLSKADDFRARARELLEQGRLQRPDDKSLALQLGLNHSMRGKIAQARGQLDAARVAFQEALQLFEQEHAHDTPGDRRLRAASYSELADLELAAGQVATAVPLYDRALPLLETNLQEQELRKKPPQDKELLARIEEEVRDEQALLAEVLGSRAKASQALGDQEAARGFFDRALILGRSVSQSEPEDTFYRWVLARLLLQRAEFEVARGERELAAGHYQEAQALSRELRRGEEPNKRYALLLGLSLLGEERLAGAQADPERASRRRAERCSLIEDFQRTDLEDSRFRILGCL